MKAAVEMEMHAAVGTRTVDKGTTLDKCFPAYDELLVALKKAVAQLERMGSDGLSSGAIDAIAKAEGRS